MRRTAALICAGLLISVLAAAAAQTPVRVTGRVVNRDGVARPRCLVEFRMKDKLRYSAYSDTRGYFSLENPQNGQYSVTVTQGSRKSPFTVTIAKDGLSPSVLAVPW